MRTKCGTKYETTGSHFMKYMRNINMKICCENFFCLSVCLAHILLLQYFKKYIHTERKNYWLRRTILFTLIVK
jgi:hypothetical protein